MVGRAIVTRPVLILPTNVTPVRILMTPAALAEEATSTAGSPTSSGICSWTSGVWIAERLLAGGPGMRRNDDVFASHCRIRIIAGETGNALLGWLAV
jgi:hypothetical protein